MVKTLLFSKIGRTMKKNILILGLFFISSLQASIYQLPTKGQNLVGEVQYLKAASTDTLSQIGINFDVGRDAMLTVNPLFEAEASLPVGVPVVIPSRYLLPNYPRKGFVINLSEKRLFYYPPGKHVVMTYPLGIGKPGHMTPLGKTYVTHTKKDPTWIPPKSIREFNKKRGIILPRVIRGGPDNPLGRRAIYLAIPQYLIHATNFPQSIGSRGSFGCMRMIERDIEELFPQVAKKTPVHIIEEPYIAGWSNGQLYLEVNEPLSENKHKMKELLKPIMKTLNAMAHRHHVTVNWKKFELAMTLQSGIPTVVSNSETSSVSLYVKPAVNVSDHHSLA